MTGYRLTGVAVLDGEMEIATVGSFIPSPGAVYTLLTSGVRVGGFDSLTFETPNALQLTGNLQYTIAS